MCHIQTITQGVPVQVLSPTALSPPSPCAPGQLLVLGEVKPEWWLKPSQGLWG